MLLPPASRVSRSPGTDEGEYAGGGVDREKRVRAADNGIGSCVTLPDRSHDGCDCCGVLAMLIDAEDPPPLLVITGASFTFVTVTAMD